MILCFGIWNFEGDPHTVLPIMALVFIGDGTRPPLIGDPITRREQPLHTLLLWQNIPELHFKNPHTLFCISFVQSSPLQSSTKIILAFSSCRLVLNYLVQPSPIYIFVCARQRKTKLWFGVDEPRRPCFL